MSHNPILNAYVIELNPIKKQEDTFRHFCKAKFFNKDESPSDAQIFTTLFENFLRALGGEKLIKDIKTKKVLGVQLEEGRNKSITAHSNSSIIEGIIDGGKYGILRQVADIENNKEREPLSSKKAILDKYYFYLYTPLNSSRGVLLIQSYTEETIQQPFKDFLQVFFSCEDYFYNLRYDNYVPERVVKKFAEESQITMFKYKTFMGVGSQLRKEIDNSIEGFEVIIQIKPVAAQGKVSPKNGMIDSIARHLGKKKFEKKELEEMSSPTVHIKNESNNNAHFNIREQIENIKPTIFLRNEGVNVDEETGVPDFNQMKDVCKNVMKEVIEEIAKKLEIDEF